MGKRFIDSFDVILLDMGRTFMFEVDRFSPSEEFGATYRTVGGRALKDEQVREVILSVFDRMLADSRDPAYYDGFASLRSYLDADPRAPALPQKEIDCLERAFALHEVGTVPAPYARALHKFRETHRLGVVSNIFCKSDLYLLEFDRAGVLRLFDVLVFSSDHGRIKPSAYLFERALRAFSVDRSKVVFVGDSLKRDVAGARVVGLSTVWINAMDAACDPGLARPDLVIRDLRDLLEE